MTLDETVPGDPDDPVREVTDVETLKALADPIRLALLAALMRSGHGEPRVMSVKELAAELGEPQTKLYRHVKQLEVTGLIRAVSSRLVSGIVEQRYQACQSDVRLGPSLTHEQKTSDDAEAAVSTVLDRYRRRFFAAQRASSAIPPEMSVSSEPPIPAEPPPDQAYRKPLLAMADARISAAKARVIRERLREVVEELSQQPDTGEDSVLVEVLIGFYSPAEPQDH